MASIDDIIKREVNPFDLVAIKPMNFWAEKQDSALTVDSIHAEAIAEIEASLDFVATNHRSRSILLLGDSGSGKSHLLGRLKRTLNSKAFFAYIFCSWSDSGHIWRHILRYTVDSLIQVPEGQQESQLMLWLKSLSAFTKSNRSIWDLLESDRQKFIKQLKDTYKQASIYNPETFFGLLHDLTNPDLYPLACEWLRGDDLSEESMQALKIKSCIETEDAAKNILANFGKISTETQPIVLCFDNLDSMPKFTNGLLEIQPLFDVNTTIHGENLKNFLVIISVITQTWALNSKGIQQADRAGIHQPVKLKNITLEQAEALWSYQLKALHQKTNPQPDSSIFPLTRQILEQSFPGGKTTPRLTINLGKKEYQEYKDKLIGDKGNGGNRKIAEFQIIWEQEYKKIQAKTGKISLLSSTDLIKMLQEALEALQLQSVKLKLLTGTYASYSLSYQHPNQGNKIGIVWSEDANLNSFNNLMNASQKAIQQNLCQNLYLIRIGNLGNVKLAGYKKYQQIFTGTQHHHIKPNLPSVHYLATYNSLVNSVLAQDLVLTGKTIKLQELQSLIRETEILHKCTLLQDLGIVPKLKANEDDSNGKRDLRPVKNFLFNVVTTQGYMGLPTLISQATSQFSDVKETDIELLISLLRDESKVKIMNPKDKFQDQLICLVT